MVFKRTNIKSKTKINSVMKNKNNTYLAETIYLARKGNIELASLLAVPSRQRIEINIDKLNEAKTDKVIVPGKVLASGDVNKKMTVYALSFSENAKEKLKKAGCTAILLLDALKKDSKLKGEIIK